MKAYNLVLSRVFQGSVCVTLYECPCHPYIENLPTLTVYPYTVCSSYNVGTVTCLVHAGVLHLVHSSILYYRRHNVCSLSEVK